jgi:hypothetical protein
MPAGSAQDRSKGGEYAIIRNQAGLNNYKISVKEWAAKTNAIGLTAKAGRYGGTYHLLCEKLYGRSLQD